MSKGTHSSAPPVTLTIATQHIEFQQNCQVSCGNCEIYVRPLGFRTGFFGMKYRCEKNSRILIDLSITFLVIIGP